MFGILLTTGCQTTHVREPLPAGWSADDPHARTEFWYQLATRPVTGNDEIFHALLLYMDGTDPRADYAERVKDLQSRMMLPPGFNGAADEAADRGTLAFALVRALKIDGGLTMHLFGNNPRYALRALEYRGIYPTCSPNQGISGAQFVGIMQKAEEYEHGNPADAPAVKLPDEIHHEEALAAVDRNDASSVTSRKPANDSLSPVLGGEGWGEGPFREFASSEKWDCRPSMALPQFALLDTRPLTPALSPEYEGEGAGRPHLAIYLNDISEEDARALFLADTTQPDVAPAEAPAAKPAKKLNVIITGAQGDSCEVRKSENDPWIKARVGLVLHESAEFRTGAKSAIRFIIPPDQTFCLDSQGTTKVLEAVANGNKQKTTVALAHGRVRTDIDRGEATGGEPIRIEQAGIEHDATIRSPNSALALRGTRVSLFDQAGFDPEAISLRGAATFINTRGETVAFGGRQRASVSGAQTSAAQKAVERTTAQQSSDLAETDFNARELAVVFQRGGFLRGDVIVGNIHLSDFNNHLPGALDFVLTWTGGKSQTENDLNLAVFSPLNSPSNHDFVANPPFTVSENPSSPEAKKLRSEFYPPTSPSGGSISKNSVGPDGLELASWPANYPVGGYRLVVFDYYPSTHPPATEINPVNYKIDVFLNGKELPNSVTGLPGSGPGVTGSIGYLQTSAVSVNIPAPSSQATPGDIRKTIATIASSKNPNGTTEHAVRIARGAR